MPGSRTRRMVARLVALAVALAVALLGAELLVGWIAPRPVLLVERGLYVADERCGYRLNPGFEGEIGNRVDFTHRVEVNAAGLRGEELPPAPRPPRILVLGDSFVFGVGAGEEETIPVRVAHHLGRAGFAAEVLNGGVPGYGAIEEEAWYRAWGAPLAPDLVVVAPFLGNDLQDAMPGRRAEVVDGLLVVPGFDPGDLSYWLFQHSNLYVLLKTSPLGDPVRRLLGRPLPLERAEEAAQLSLYRREGGSELERVAGPATEAAIRALAAAVPAGRLAAVLLPGRLEVESEAWRAALGRQGLDGAAHDRARLARWYGELFARAEVPVLDLSEPLAREADRGVRVYYPHDGHYTPRGYDLVAAELARFLVESSPNHFARPPS